MKASGSARSERRAKGPMGYHEGTLTISLHVQPNARRTEWAGAHGEGALRLRVAAPAAEGKANQVCLRFLASTFGVPRSAVALISGAASRDKLVRIAAVDPQRYQEFLQTCSS